MADFRSSLGSIAPMLRQPDPANGRSAAARIWHELGIVVINPEHLNGWADAVEAKQLATRLYGERKDG